MTEKDLVNEGKEERQKTMDKLSIESGKAYTYEKEKEGSGCLSDAREAREKTQAKLDQ
jgi:hypothetical protein